jgi:PhnB protein
MTKPIPEGYHALTPSLAVDNAAQAIEFYKRAFGAKERMRMMGPGDMIGHAELEIGDSVLMLADPMPQSTVKAPKALGGTSVGIFLYVEDVDEVVQQAIDAGATVTMPVEDQFWGDRYGVVADPFGHQWQIATHKEDLTPEEIRERSEKALAGITWGAGAVGTSAPLTSNDAQTARNTSFTSPGLRLVCRTDRACARRWLPAPRRLLLPGARLARAAARRASGQPGRGLDPRARDHRRLVSRAARSPCST